MGKLDRREIVRILREISALLQIRGENPYKSRAYDIGAQRLESLTDKELETFVAEERLTELPGIGEAIAAKVTELHETGASTYYEDLRKDYPPRLRELMMVPGLGPKKISTLFKELGIGSVEDLQKACEEGRVSKIKGFSGKAEKQILEGIRSMGEVRSERKPIAEVRHVAEQVLARVKSAPGVVRAELAGSVRRFAETVADVDIVASAADPAPVMERFIDTPQVLRVLGRGDTKSSVVLSDGLQVDLRVVPDESFATALHHFTGSKAHHIRLRGRAHELGLKISEYAVERLDGSGTLDIRDERALYAALGMAYVPPEAREDAGEVEAALVKKLPKFLDLADVKGITHAHTTWSDGKASILEMARAAKALGAGYLTITDHSPAAHYANGVTLNRIRRQWDEIDAVQEQVPEVLLLKGTEADILQDGTIDYPEEILAKLDIVIASIHQRFKQDEAQMTARVLKAMDNPYVHVWGHPTGRYIGSRDPAPMDLPRLLDKAAQKGIAVEVNGNPERLDLSAENVKMATRRGVKLVVSTDAHSISGLGSCLRYSVATARRGWAEAKDVLNTLPAKEFKAALRTMRT